jgi:hypothetical protein
MQPISKAMAINSVRLIKTPLFLGHLLSEPIAFDLVRRRRYPEVFRWSRSQDLAGIKTAAHSRAEYGEQTKGEERRRAMRQEQRRGGLTSCATLAIEHSRHQRSARLR